MSRLVYPASVQASVPRLVYPPWYPPSLCTTLVHLPTHLAPSPLAARGQRADTRRMYTESGTAPRLIPSKWKYYLKVLNYTLCHTVKNGRPRYSNYFPDSRKHTAFNREKCKMYFCYLNAKGLFYALYRYYAHFGHFTDLHGN